MRSSQDLNLVGSFKLWSDALTTTELLELCHWSTDIDTIQLQLDVRSRLFSACMVPMLGMVPIEVLESCCLSRNPPGAATASHLKICT